MIEIDFGSIGLPDLGISFMADDKTIHDKREEGHHHDGKHSNDKRLQESQQQVREAPPTVVKPK